MTKNKNLRATYLKDYIGETCHFLGKIKRSSSVIRESQDNEEINATLVNSLYININDDWKYISHAWIQLPDEISQCKGNILLFEGEVYEYEHTNGLEDYSIHFKKAKKCEPWDEPYYHGIRMHGLESDDQVKYQRRRVNNNLTIINAYENGIDLDLKHNFKGKKKELEKRRLQTEKICKKEYFAEKEYQLSPILMQQVYRDGGGFIEKSEIKNRKVVNTLDELCEELSKIASSVTEKHISIARETV